jgi:hypothetical protein
VFVVELLGNGKRNRALIRKGQLSHIEHLSSLGHMFALFDEAGSPVQVVKKKIYNCLFSFVHPCLFAGVCARVWSKL